MVDTCMSEEQLGGTRKGVDPLQGKWPTHKTSWGKTGFKKAWVWRWSPRSPAPRAEVPRCTGGFHWAVNTQSQLGGSISDTVCQWLQVPWSLLKNPGISHIFSERNLPCNGVKQTWTKDTLFQTDNVQVKMEPIRRRVGKHNRKQRDLESWSGLSHSPGRHCRAPSSLVAGQKLLHTFILLRLHRIHSTHEHKERILISIWL